MLIYVNFLIFLMNARIQSDNLDRYKFHQVQLDRWFCYASQKQWNWFKHWVLHHFLFSLLDKLMEHSSELSIRVFCIFDETLPQLAKCFCRYVLFCCFFLRTVKAKIKLIWQTSKILEWNNEKFEPHGESHSIFFHNALLQMSLIIYFQLLFMILMVK